MSQLQMLFGRVATNSGFTVAGWLACRRRSCTSSATRSTRYIVGTEHT